MVFISLLVFHFCTISGVSLISGKYGDIGISNKDFFMGKAHAAGVLCLFLAGSSITIGECINQFDFRLVVGGAFMALDLLLIGRYFIYGKS
ncbi:hypothetical protein [Sphingomonas ursincola]|uniref:Uncharacterized protein n=1 Tax=Sphingomonas ursincola TaxID=56361 RepID=A0A7V8RDE9_9SPHN|nr:hypothetical protein [Sphingomonas ursincola]MBA1374432.1 hypothetical protein [Sphingomonas ursincola]